MVETTTTTAASSYGSILLKAQQQQAEAASSDDGGVAKDTKTETTPLIKPSAANDGESGGADKRSCWSLLAFTWFTSILKKGNAKKKLDPEDMDEVPLPEDCTTLDVMATFDQCWEEELLHHKKDPSLVRALFRAFGADYIRAGVLKLIHDLCVFVGPQVLRAVIVYLRDPTAELSYGLSLVAAVTVSQIVMSLCLRHYFFKCYTTGLRIRTAIVVAVYRKAVVLSSGERQARTIGEITNLTSIDATRLQELTKYLHSLWSSPLQIALAMYFLWRALGPSFLGGVSIIVIMIPVTRFVAKWMGKMQKILMKVKDQRVEINTEVLSGMRVIKFQAWEEPFAKRIMDIRNNELHQLLVYMLGSATSRMLWVVTPLLVALSTFAVYVCTGHNLDVAEALTALALFDILRFPLFMFPQIINSAVEASISLSRVRNFLLCDEHHPIGAGDLDEVGVRIRNLSAAYDTKKPRMDGETDPTMKELAEKQWEVALLQSQLNEAERLIRQMRNDENDAEEEVPAGGGMNHQSLLCLRRIDFDCKAGELIGFVGGVGCGKSSFVNSILGEVRELTGKTEVSGSLAYFSQTPFILNATLRDNILFGHVGEPVDEDLYQRAISCCALTHDLELLPDGDLTEIGEKGITLSGGQKARVALARAVYHQADITLIDDALAAVDAHVAKVLFEEAIVGELMKPTSSGKKRSVILVTNALQYLSHPRVDKIVVLQEGRVVETGSYEELASKENYVFARFLSVLNETGATNGSEATNGFEPDGTNEESTAEKQAAVEQTSKSTELGKGIPQKLMTEETRKTGHVDARMYWIWCKAAGGWIAPVAILSMFTVVESIAVVSNWWLTYWSQHGHERSQMWFLGIYAAIGLATAISGLVRMLMVSLFGLKASRELFSNLLSGVLSAKMSFFDTTPVGRLTNRFSKDIYTVDEQLPNTLRTYLQTLFSVFSTIVVISCVSPVFLLVLLPMALFYLKEQQYFTLTYRELKRLDSVTRSPIYALLGESVDGVAVIRAFSAEQSLLGRLVTMLDIQQHAYFLTCAAQSWLAVRLELVGTLIILFSVLSAVLEHASAGADETFAGLAGLAISYALSVTQSLNWTVRMASDMEANMVAVERIDEYRQLEQEGDRETPADKHLVGWPVSGQIDFRDVKLRYRPTLPLVLKGLNLHIPGGSKVGVVGRTGAGKSTLMVALMRIVELSEGQIFIDGRDIRAVGLVKLRKNIAVIPQDPVLFSGTVRSNLDPFDDFDDESLYGVLENVGLYRRRSIEMSSHSAAHRIESIDEDVSEGGANFSVGQRQLLVIARALLRGSRIVIMDEATASVDAETDAAIQTVMRFQFASATCITVAHRLNTIMDSDYVLCMDNGVVGEFGPPAELLQKPDGLFSALVKAGLHE